MITKQITRRINSFILPDGNIYDTLRRFTIVVKFLGIRIYKESISQDIDYESKKLTETRPIGLRNSNQDEKAESKSSSSNKA